MIRNSELAKFTSCFNLRSYKYSNSRFTYNFFTTISTYFISNKEASYSKKFLFYRYTVSSKGNFCPVHERNVKKFTTCMGEFSKTVANSLFTETELFLRATYRCRFNTLFSSSQKKI